MKEKIRAGFLVDEEIWETFQNICKAYDFSAGLLLRVIVNLVVTEKLSILDLIELMAKNMPKQTAKP